MFEIKIRKKCIGCGKEFETWFPLRTMCTSCILNAYFLSQKKKLILDDVDLKMWDEENA